jgi:hypothetical protein
LKTGVKKSRVLKIVISKTVLKGQQWTLFLLCSTFADF